MNYLKKIAFTLALVAGLCGGAWAQNLRRDVAYRRWDNHVVYRNNYVYRPAQWGVGVYSYPYSTYGYYPYGTYNYYYPNGVYGYYPYSYYSYYPYGYYGYYPYRTWGNWGYYPRGVPYRAYGWHGGARAYGHDGHYGRRR